MTTRSPRRLRHPLALCMLLAVTMPAAAQSPAPDAAQTAKLYSLDAMLARITQREAQGPDLRLNPPVDEPIAFAQEGFASDRHEVVSAMARLVAAFVEPPLGPDDHVQPLGARWLAVAAQPAQHQWIEHFLADGGRRRDPIQITCELYRMPETAFRGVVAPALLPKPFDGSDARVAGDLPSSFVLAPDDDTTAFRRGLATLPDVNCLQAPRVLVEPLMLATLDVGEQRSFVKDWVVESNRDSTIADPVLGIVREGLAMQFLGCEIAPQTVALAIELSVSTLAKPMASFRTTLPGSGQPLTIQLPEVSVQRVRATVELPPRHAALLLLPPIDGERCLAVIEAAVVSPEPERR